MHTSQLYVCNKPHPYIYSHKAREDDDEWDGWGGGEVGGWGDDDDVKWIQF